jgi:hypothetical protein
MSWSEEFLEKRIVIQLAKKFLPEENQELNQ